MHRGVPLTGSIIFAAGVMLGLAAFGGDTSLPERNDIPSASPAFEAGTRTHETRAKSQTALEFPNVGEIPAQAETGLSQGPAPTRSGFMASWDSVSGAIGYRLDVSMSSSFSSYVNGYRDLDVGNVTGRVVTGLSPGTTYYYRVRAYDATSLGRYSDVMTVATTATAGLIIHATFDSSITTNPNAAAIEAMINRAISIYESLFSDPITIQILFRYSATAPDGTPLPSGTTSQSDFVVYTISWSAYINALRADAKTSNDILANASLPGTALSPNIKPSSAGGRAVGLNTPPAMSANGSLGGPYDGIVTLNSSDPFQFTRPPSASNYDGQRSTEHEIDEVIGFGSDASLSNLRPQDLFSWSSTGHRNVSSTGARYFSINSGSTNIVNFNQNSNGDFGDWLSLACPQAHPYVQNAFSCAGQFSDVTATSPEGINLDVIGYDLVTTTATLRIDSVAPPAGRTSGGQQIKLTGEFAGLSTVTMGGSSASWFYTNGSSDTSMITVTTPAHALGAVNIVLTPTSGSTLTKTNAFAYLPTVFTDNTIMVGQTTAKAQHILELRQAVDAMRAVAGLSGAPWNDPALAAGNTIRAVHITDLRTFLDDAATRLGFSTSPYTEPGLTTGFVIKRIHIEELRQRIRTIAG